jgi:uracil-DNA glycosylase family 4
MLSSIYLKKKNTIYQIFIFEKHNDKISKYNFYELIKHIKIIQPKYILFLGETAANFFNNSNQLILDIRGKWGSIIINNNKINTFATFDPKIY